MKSKGNSKGVGHFTRKPVLWQLRSFGAYLVVMLAVCLAACSSASTEAGPHVILITLDTVRADYFSSYGYEYETTPCMDSLASDGVRFAYCSSTASLTPVSHASILSGLNPYQHGLRVLHAAEGYQLPEDVPILTSILKERGWSTAAFLSSYPVSERFGFDRDFDHWDNGLDLVRRKGGGNGRREPQARRQRRSDATTQAALDWLDGEQADGRGDDSKFLWLHYWDPHDEILLPPMEAQQRFGDEMGVGDVNSYDFEVWYLDSQVGRLMDGLKQRGIYEDALIVLTADHGEGLGEHDWKTHRLLYQEQVHVPLLLKLPASQPAELAVQTSVVEQLVSSIDIAPTVLSALNLPSPPMEGRDLSGLWGADPTQEQGPLVYADQLNLWDSKAAMLVKRPQDDLLHMVMDAEWKLIYRPLRPAESELYNWKLDPDEAENRYLTEPEVAQALLADLNRRDPWVLQPFGEGEDSGEAVEALGELGYLEVEAPDGDTSEDSD